ncbi:MAG TPA: signal recognition particle subunit SRP19/SEC65 family protein [Candidatus Thermoplasmatota archaeon]|nr:signal recognition particle subunit SRP19/SEC65 family protein [Candidatus Thermoplasmatota archaeon]
MVSRDDNRLVLWPAYFDEALPRPIRRVPKALAIENPTADEIAKAAQRLSLSPILEKGVAHPRFHRFRQGRVLVEIRGSKAVLIQQIAADLKAARGK